MRTRRFRRRQARLRATLRKVMRLPRWVFRSLAVMGAEYCAALDHAGPDLRPRHTDRDLRYDV